MSLHALMAITTVLPCRSAYVFPRIDNGQLIEYFKITGIARDQLTNVMSSERGDEQSVCNAFTTQLELLEEVERIERHGLVRAYTHHVGSAEVETGGSQGVTHGQRRIEAPGIRYHVDKLVEHEGSYDQRNVRITELRQDVAAHTLKAAMAFYPRTADGRDVTLRPEGTGFVDQETGSVWNVEGRAVSGPLAGSSVLAHDGAFVAF